MSSLIYNSCLYNVFRSNIHFDTDTFRMMLVVDYTSDVNHEKRSDIHGELPTGNGYTRGGLEVVVNVTKDEKNNRIDMILGEAVWPNSTLSASGAVYYRSSNNSRTEDLVCFIEFDKETSSSNGIFKVTESILRIQN